MARKEIVINSALQLQHYNFSELFSYLPLENRVAFTRYFNGPYINANRNTQKAFEADIAQYLLFCNGIGANPLSDNIIEAQDLLLSYFTSLIDTPLLDEAGYPVLDEEGDPTCRFKHSTIKRRLASVSKLYSIAALTNPLNTIHCRDTIKNTLRDRKIFASPEAADALRYEDVIRITAAAPKDKLVHLRDIAMLNMAFDGLLRFDEIRQLYVSDINRRTNKVTIRRSKTDKEGKGQTRYISNNTIALIDNYIHCANTTYKGLPRHQDDPQSIQSGLLFRAVSPKGTSLRAVNQEKKYYGYLDHNAVINAYRKLALNAGYPGDIKFSGHSPRVGAAVSLAEANIDGLEIQRAGGWTSQDMPARYTQKASHQETGVARLRKEK